MISGKPVRSSIGRTSRPASVSSRAVPPVEISSTPRPASPRAKSATPRLSETDSSARRTRTSPGCVIRAHLTAAALDHDGAARDRADRPGQELVLERAQRLLHRGGIGGVRQLERALGDDRAAARGAVRLLERARGDAGRARPLQCPRRRLVRGDGDDLEAGTPVEAVEDGLEVGALARGEGADPHAASAGPCLAPRPGLARAALTLPPAPGSGRRWT